MSSKSTPPAAGGAAAQKAPTAAHSGSGGLSVASIFGGSNLKDLFTQRGLEDILNWTNPVLSSFVFLFANLCIYIIFYGNYSLVSVACYLAMVHLVATFCLCQVGYFIAKFQSKNPPILLALRFEAVIFRMCRSRARQMLNSPPPNAKTPQKSTRTLPSHWRKRSAAA